jgi:hypothetical protein
MPSLDTPPDIRLAGLVALDSDGSQVKVPEGPKALPELADKGLRRRPRRGLQGLR